MGYLHISNVSSRRDALEIYALSKVDGSSGHIAYKEGRLRFFSGCAKQDHFEGLFDHEHLLKKFEASFRPDQEVVVYGEVFGGKIQGHSAVYGKELRFICFDVKVDQVWMDLGNAVGVVKSLGLEFVPFERGPLTVEFLNSQRDLPDQLAIVPDAKREGVVVRPIYELTYNNGERFIYKHKRDDFRETKTPRPIDAEKMAVIEAANEVADEYVVMERLRHVLQKTPFNSDADTGLVIRAMIEDVKRESEGEVVWGKDCERAIGKATVKLLRDLEPAAPE